MHGETEVRTAAELGQVERECAPAWHAPEVVIIGIVSTLFSSGTSSDGPGWTTS